jgi:hypothetical protein
VALASGVFREGLTQSSPAPEPERAEGTKTGHENAEGMAGFCVRVQRTVRLRREVEGFRWEHSLTYYGVALHVSIRVCVAFYL